MDVAYNYIFENGDLMENLDKLDNIVRRPRIFKRRRHFFEEHDDVDFCTRFRLSKESVLFVLGLIEDKLEFPSDRNEAISPINQLLLTLRYYATGSQQITVGNYSGASKSTTHRIIHRVTTAIASLSRYFIKFPDSENEIRETKLSFYKIAQFPKALGALGCTHIRVRSSGGENAEFFRNNKGYMSINVQVIGNADLEILDLVARWPGSFQDQTVWNASYRNAVFESNRYGDSVLLADIGYLDQPYLMMPLENPSTPEEIHYNESQTRSRYTIECLFEVWKRRFPVLALGMQIQLKNSLAVIVATAILHNIAVKAKEDLPLDDPDLKLPNTWEELLLLGHITDDANTSYATESDSNPVRRRLINEYFKNMHLNTL